MTARWLVVEGPDGVGKSGLVDRLAAALGARPYHHPRPREGADSLEAALHYARCRRELYRGHGLLPVGLVVLDRCVESSEVLGAALAESWPQDRVGLALESLARVERAFLAPWATLVLDAPDEVLDARLAARGERPTRRDGRIRREYRALARWRRLPVVRTDGDRQETLAAALEIAREAWL